MERSWIPDSSAVFADNETAWYFTVLTYDYICDHGSHLRRCFFLPARQRLVVVYLFLFYSMHDANIGFAFALGVLFPVLMDSFNESRERVGEFKIYPKVSTTNTSVVLFDPGESVFIQLIY